MRKPGRPQKLGGKTARIAIVLGLSTLKAIEELATMDGLSRVDWIRWALARQLRSARSRVA